MTMEQPTPARSGTPTPLELLKGDEVDFRCRLCERAFLEMDPPPDNIEQLSRESHRRFWAYSADYIRRRGPLPEQLAVGITSVSAALDVHWADKLAWKEVKGKQARRGQARQGRVR